MLPRSHRIRTKKEFLRVYRKGKRRAFDIGVVYWMPHHDRVRFGFVISNKVHKSAVVRNRIRRWFRATAQMCIDQRHCGDVVIQVTPRPYTIQYGDIQKLFRQIFPPRSTRGEMGSSQMH